MMAVDRTRQAATNTPAQPKTTDNTDNTWVSEVLEADNLRLAGAKRLEPYGRAKLGKWTRILMWTMRVYVVLSFILIIAQIYISLNLH